CSCPGGAAGPAGSSSVAYPRPASSKRLPAAAIRSECVARLFIGFLLQGIGQFGLRFTAAGVRMPYKELGFCETIQAFRIDSSIETLFCLNDKYKSQDFTAAATAVPLRCV